MIRQLFMIALGCRIISAAFLEGTTLHIAHMKEASAQMGRRVAIGTATTIAVSQPPPPQPL